MFLQLMHPETFSEIPFSMCSIDCYYKVTILDRYRTNNIKNRSIGRCLKRWCKEAFQLELICNVIPGLQSILKMLMAQM